MFGEYRLIAYVILGSVLLGIGGTAVLSYNHFVSKAATQEQQLKLRDQVISEQQQIVADKIHEAEVAKKYQVEAEQRRIESDNKLKKIMSMESKRDEKGNITSDDPILASLNGMCPGGQTGEGTPNATAGAAVQKSGDTAGAVAGTKDILPQ